MDDSTDLTQTAEAVTTDEHVAHHNAIAERLRAERGRGLSSATGRVPVERQGVTWMRISDAVASGSARVAGRGLDLHAALGRRIRTAPAVSRRAIAERSHRLAPLSAFGIAHRSSSLQHEQLGRR